MTQLDKLIAYTELRLATVNLKLSDFGKAAIAKRFAKPEADGGYSVYWHNL